MSPISELYRSANAVHPSCLSQANVSKHLRVLHDEGILHRSPQGTAAYYSVSDPTIAGLCDLVCDRIRIQKREEAEAFA